MDHPASYAHLNRSIADLAAAAPGVMSGFARLQDASHAEGALSAKVKELMALAIGIAVHCEGCVTYHVHDALAAGATAEEIAETVGVAILMGGGPAVVYGAEALEALAQFRATPAEAPS
jgi:AhpD family alkylhydroperoxidase